ncbi:MAG TPA: MOSC domain-containing protein [Burkholderiales bacterium]|nr:MOSC domain-containing protein [Burkholderiales bacterium]
MPPSVHAVHQSATHSFSKTTVAYITLVEGLGVKGDAHSGATVKHRSRVASDPSKPNLRQVHLLQSELFAELASAGFVVLPGQIGENITTEGVDLLSLPTGTDLSFGSGPVVRLTGLRNPCWQLDAFQPGLMAAVFGRTAEGELVRKTGVMGVVIRGGTVSSGQTITVTLPDGPHLSLKPV